MIKELNGMTLEDFVRIAIPQIAMLGDAIKPTGTLAGLTRQLYMLDIVTAPTTISVGETEINLNPDDFETDVDGFAALLAIFQMESNK